MFKIKHLLSLVFLLCIGAVHAQNLSIVDCSTVLIFPEDSTSVVDTLVDITSDDMFSDESDFGIMFILEVTDSSLVDQVNITMGNSIGDSNLLSGSYDINSNVSLTDLIYEPYSNFINIKVGEHTIDSVLHYSINLEDINGNQSSSFSGTIEK